MKKLSILSPLKIQNEKRFNIFCQCLDSYEDLLKSDYVEFLVVNESTEEFKNRVKDKISSKSENVKYYESNGMVNSVRLLIDKSNSDYIMFLLDDVMLLFDTNETLINCMLVMDKYEDVDQIKYGGGKINNANQKQIENFKKTHTPLYEGDDIIWLNDSNKEPGEYTLSQWNCISRSKTLKEINHKYKGGARNWDAYALMTSEIYKNKPKSKTGWLNLCCGLYAFGRDKYTLEVKKNIYDSNYRR